MCFAAGPRSGAWTFWGSWSELFGYEVAGRSRLCRLLWGTSVSTPNVGPGLAPAMGPPKGRPYISCWAANVVHKRA